MKGFHASAMISTCTVVLFVSSCGVSQKKAPTDLPTASSTTSLNNELKPMTFEPSTFPAVEPVINSTKQKVEGLKLSVTPTEGNLLKPVLESELDLQQTYRVWPFVWVYLGPVDGPDIDPWRLIYGIQINCDPSPYPMPLDYQRVTLINKGGSTSFPWSGEAQYCDPVRGRAETRAPAGRYRVYVDVQNKPEWFDGSPAPPMLTSDQLVRLWSEELIFRP